MKWTLSFCLALLALVSSNAATIKQGFTIHEGPFTNKGPFRISTNGTSTAPGFAFPSHSGDPSSLTDGDVWYNSSSGKFRAREGGSTKDVISVGGGGGSGIGSGATNITWVSAANGSDSTGTKGDWARPYASFRAALSNATSGSEIWILPGTYVERATLVNHAWTNVDCKIRDKTNITIRGFGQPLISVTNQGTSLAILACSNIFFHGLEFQFFKTNAQVAHNNIMCVYTYGTNSDIGFTDCGFRNSEGWALCFGGEATTYADRAYVRGSRFYNCGATNWASGVFAEGGAIQFSGSYSELSGSKFVDCGRINEWYITLGSGRTGRGVIVKDNFISGTWENTVFCNGGDPWYGGLISGNFVDGGARQWSGTARFMFTRSTGTLIQGNTFSNLNGTAIVIGSMLNNAFTCEGSIVANNYIVNCDGGIRFGEGVPGGAWGMLNGRSYGNTMINVTNRSMLIYGVGNKSQNDTFINCANSTFFGAVEFRAWAGGCSNNIIEGATITTNSSAGWINSYGIYAHTDATNNSIYDCNIETASLLKILDQGSAFRVIHWREANGNVKLAPQGTSITDRTNPPTATLHVHGSVSLPTTYFQSGTVSNGGAIYADKGNLFVNTLTANTNYTVYNISDGQAIELWSTNSTFTETFTQFPASLWLSGSVEPASQNSVNRWIITRTGSRTNIQHFGVELTPTAGSQIGFTTNGTSITFGVTNRITLLASNTTSATIDFSGTTDTYEIMTMGNTNVVLSPTNLISGRALRIVLTANNNNYDTVFTNTAQTAIRWAMSCPTNGSTSFTVTNGTRAEVSLLVRSNEVWAVYAYFR